MSLLPLVILLLVTFEVRGQVADDFATKKDEFPFLVSIVEKATGEHRCNAALFNETIIMSSAACLDIGHRISDFQAVFASYEAADLKAGGGSSQVWPIDEVVVHPCYMKNNETNPVFNIAWANIGNRLAMSKSIVKVGTKQITELDMRRKTGKALMIGRGLKYFKDGKPRIPQKYEGNREGNGLCKEKNPKMDEYGPEVCFKSKNGLCVGDEGGILITEWGDGEWLLNGFYSFTVGGSEDCGQKPLVFFTDPSHFYCFIALNETTGAPECEKPKCQPPNNQRFIIKSKALRLIQPVTSSLLFILLISFI